MYSVSFDPDADINECESNPCLNGGTCSDYVGHYTCECPEGYEGINCQPGKKKCQDVTNNTNSNWHISYIFVETLWWDLYVIVSSFNTLIVCFFVWWIDNERHVSTFDLTKVHWLIHSIHFKCILSIIEHVIYHWLTYIMTIS